MATHSNILAWRIPGMGEPGGLPSMGSHRVGHDWSNLAATAAAAAMGPDAMIFLYWMLKFKPAFSFSFLTLITRLFSFSSFSAAATAAKSLQSCPTLCDPIDGSPPGSPVPGIIQARTLEWVAISFSNAWKWKVKVKSLSCVWLLATPWTAAHQAPPSMGYSRQEYWSGVPLPSPLHSLVYQNSHIWVLLIVSLSQKLCSTVTAWPYSIKFPFPVQQMAKIMYSYLWP